MACDCNVEAGQYIEDKFFLLKLRATDRTKVAITDPKKKKKQYPFEQENKKLKNQRRQNRSTKKVKVVAASKMNRVGFEYKDKRVWVLFISPKKLCFLFLFFFYITNDILIVWIIFVWVLIFLLIYKLVQNTQHINRNR